MGKCWGKEDNGEWEVGKESSRELNGECADGINRARQGMEFLS